MRASHNICAIFRQKRLHTHTAHKFLLCGKDGHIPNRPNLPFHSTFFAYACGRQMKPKQHKKNDISLLGALCYEVPNG